MSEDRRALDDAAAAALWALAHAPVEHIGLLYEQDGRILATPTQTRNNAGRTKGSFKVPAGSLRAIFHNHPPRRSERGDLSASRRDSLRSEFSLDDIIQAQRLGVPSYIAAGNKLRRFDPATGRTEDVLARIPIQELIMAMARDILGRAPNDPRGLRREGPTPQVSSDELRDLPKFDPVRPQAIKPRRILANRSP